MCSRLGATGWWWSPRPSRRPSVAEQQVGAEAFSAAWLIHQHGYRWDEDGHWAPGRGASPAPEARLRPGDLLLVDEAGMLDQDTARALLTIADETRSPDRVRSATGTSSPPSAAAASSTTPPAGVVPKLASSWRPCTGSPTPSTPT